MIVITQSIIKEFLYHGELREYCPNRAYSHLMVKTHNLTTASQEKGNYFETLCIGGGYEGKKTTDLPRKKNGDKTTDQLRIEEQHMRFAALSDQYKMVIVPGVNTQATIFKRFDDEVLLEAHMDIFPVSVQLQPDQEPQYAIIDTKLTSDLKSTFGMFNWNNAASLDHTQAYMYMECATDIDFELNATMGNPLEEFIKNAGLTDTLLAQTPVFMYFVFDYSPRKNVKIIRVSYDEMRRKELYQSVKVTKEIIQKHNRLDNWADTLPSKENCMYCACDCPFRFNTDGSDDSESEQLGNSVEFENV